MSRNYGAGSRDMSVAGSFLLKKSESSYGTKSELNIRWNLFCIWIRAYGIKKMENITRELVVKYGEYLRNRVISGEISAATGQNYLSAVNRIMSLATKGEWQPIRPVADCQIPRRKFVATENKSSSDSKYLSALNHVTDSVKILMELQRTFGLRFRESVLLDTHKALKEATKNGEIHIIRGTKGGRKRTVPVDSFGITVLENAAAGQTDYTFIPTGVSYKEFRSQCYEESKLSGINFHSNRHYYTHRRYKEITGAPCPVENGWTGRERIPKLAEYLSISIEEAKNLDHDARLLIASELGHNRVEVTGAYVG